MKIHFISESGEQLLDIESEFTSESGLRSSAFYAEKIKQRTEEISAFKDKYKLAKAREKAKAAKLKSGAKRKTLQSMATPEQKIEALRNAIKKTDDPDRKARLKARLAKVKKEAKATPSVKAKKPAVKKPVTKRKPKEAKPKHSPEVQRVLDKVMPLKKQLDSLDLKNNKDKAKAAELTKTIANLKKQAARIAEKQKGG